MSWVATAVGVGSAIGGVAGGILGKKKSNTDNSYNNPTLDTYTQPFRSVAPWTFASLDPTATVAAMGNTNKVGGKNLGHDFAEYIRGLSKEEKAGAQASQDALQRIQTRQQSGQFLTPQETEFINTNLDKAFEYIHKTGYADWERGSQMLAGGRGLRTSDTPIGDVSMRNLRDFELGLGSERAKLGLDATMKMSVQQNVFDESLREFQQSLAQNRWQARQGFMFGGGMQGAGNVAYSGNARSMSTDTTGSVQGAQQGLNLGTQLMAGFSSAWGSNTPAAGPTPAPGKTPWGTY